MKIDMQNIDDLNATLSIQIEKSDYEADFKKQLKKQASGAQLKGFRKGKTPLGVIKKMYGRSVLAQVINTSLQDALGGYIEEQNLDILGQPLPSSDQEGDIDFDPNNLQDFTFKFDVGLSPQFEIKGVSEADTYEVHDVQLTESIIKEEIGHITKRFGTQEEVEGAIEAKDIIQIQADELDGDSPKENGWATEFTVMVDVLADEYKEKVLALKSGDTFDFDPYALEADKSEDYVQKYILNISEDDAEVEINPTFRGKISSIKRLVPAAFDQELFDKYFPEGEVSSEEEAKGKIKEHIQKYYDTQATQVMYREIMDKLIEDTHFDLPEEFLKRWLKESNEKAEEADIDKDFDPFLKNLKWTLIKSKLAKSFDVKVEAEDVYQAMQEKVKGYFGQYGIDNEYMGKIMQNMMQNREEVNKTYEELMAERVFDKIGETVQKSKKAIALDDFNELVKELNSKHQAAK